MVSALVVPATTVFKLPPTIVAKPAVTAVVCVVTVVLATTSGVDVGATTTGALGTIGTIGVVNAVCRLLTTGILKIEVPSEVVIAVVPVFTTSKGEIVVSTPKLVPNKLADALISIAGSKLVGESALAVTSMAKMGVVAFASSEIEF